MCVTCRRSSTGKSFWADAFDGDWAARNKSNGNTERLDEKHGGKIRYGGSFFVHTFAALVPPEEFFKSHPEYFSEVDGKRLDGYAQVCVTNEEVEETDHRPSPGSFADRPHGADHFGLAE